MVDGSNLVFILASPRSGTTLLANVLGKHSQISEWYEPYFVWFWQQGYLDDDGRTEQHATRDAVKQIRREFELFSTRTRANLVVEKLPEHAFQIPMVNAVFPGARYIHLFRDGRDVVNSIHREWQKRLTISKSGNLPDFLRLTWSMLQRQPLWRHRVQAIRFELNQRSLFGGNLYNKAKWADSGGWGPRFPGWKDAFKALDLLAFNCEQWLECEHHITRDLASIPANRVMQLRYEDLVNQPAVQLKRIVSFCDLKFEQPHFATVDATIDANRTQQWRTAFSDDERQLIGPLLEPHLLKLGYDDAHSWWQQGESVANPQIR